MNFLPKNNLLWEGITILIGSAVMVWEVINEKDIFMLVREKL